MTGESVELAYADAGYTGAQPAPEAAQMGMAHCQTCMEACRRGEQACNTVLSLLPG